VTSDGNCMFPTSAYSPFPSFGPFPPLTCILPCRCPSSRHSHTTSPTKPALAADSSRDPTACHGRYGIWVLEREGGNNIGGRVRG